MQNINNKKLTNKYFTKVQLNHSEEYTNIEFSFFSFPNMKKGWYCALEMNSPIFQNPFLIIYSGVENSLPQTKINQWHHITFSNTPFSLNAKSYFNTSIRPIMSGQHHKAHDSTTDAARLRTKQVVLDLCARIENSAFEWTLRNMLFKIQLHNIVIKKPRVWSHSGDALLARLRLRTLRKLYFHFLSHWMKYDRGDSYPFDFKPNGFPFGSKSKGKLSPRSYPIQFERKRNYSFLSADAGN